MIRRLVSPLVSVVRFTAALTLVGAATLVACGGHASTTEGPAADAGTTTVEGTIDGVSLPVAYAVAIPDNSNATGGPTNQYTRLALGIANKPLGCNTPSIPNGTILGFSIIAPGTAPVGPGSYEINTNSASAVDNVAALVTTDASCAESSPSSVIGGTVTIIDATDTMITGSFSLAFDSGEALQGTFAAPVCAAIPPSLQGTAC